MKKEEIVDRFSGFLKENYYKDLATATTEGKKALEVDFSLIDRFDPELADEILKIPDDAIKFFDDSVEQIDLPKKIKFT